MKRTVNVSDSFEEVSISSDCVTVGGFPGTLLSAVIQCTFGLSPKFSTPVEKAVEKPPPTILPLLWNHEPLGRNPRAHRDEGQPAQLLHMVPADDVRRGGPHFGHRAGAERPVQRLADQALRNRHH